MRAVGAASVLSRWWVLTGLQLRSPLARASDLVPTVVIAERRPPTSVVSR